VRLPPVWESGRQECGAQRWAVFLDGSQKSKQLILNVSTEAEAIGEDSRRFRECCSEVQIL
jgi:hypothetical protein